jgi:hypothetical protein
MMNELFFSDVLPILNIVVLLYVWFQTDAVIEWAELLKLKFFKYHEYRAFKLTPLSKMVNNYSEFLAYKYSSSFFIRLITCPICLTVWLNILALSVIHPSIGRIKVFGLNVILCWFLYPALKWAIKKWNA